jgi:hypothetical protein
MACKCRTGCAKYRCDCLKNNQGCSGECVCTDCKNPLNGRDTAHMSQCAIQHIKFIDSLTEKQLEKKYLLLCECKEVPLKLLINKYDCQKCKETCWFSFCFKEVAQNSCSWHCSVCKSCRDWREWHCKKCNRCTYGVSLPCENCESKNADYAHIF